MISYKIKYIATNDTNNDIEKCIRQFTSAYHYAYNRFVDGFSYLDIKHKMKGLNNVENVDAYMKACAATSAKQTYTLHKDNVIIFGGKENFIKRNNGSITKDEYKENRLVPYFSIGESNMKGNRKFHINPDLHSITFLLNKKTKIQLKLKGIYGKREKDIATLYKLQEESLLPITYYLHKNYIAIVFDESRVNNIKRDRSIHNRVMAIDMNPNYVGWSVVDWKDDDVFDVIDSGVFSLKNINNKTIGHKSKHNEKDIFITKLNNKRRFETLEISKKLIDICLHYQCESFSIEKLDICAKDFHQGKEYNRLVNNNWNRVKLILNLRKRCNKFDIKFIQVVPQYSSFIGNFLYRHLSLPDMILASIEIGRRGYEYNEQYITKTKEIANNISFPKEDAFRAYYIKSLEEFNIGSEGHTLKEIYDLLKKSKTKYRLSLKDTKTEFSRCFSERSLIQKFCMKC